MWCRFDVNRSDIDMATGEEKGYSASNAKSFLIERFMEDVEMRRHVEELLEVV